MGSVQLSQEELEKKAYARAFERLCEKKPALRKKYQQFLEQVDKKERKKFRTNLARYFNGQITWAELMGVSQAQLKEMAKLGHFILRYSKDYSKAETLFQGLSVMDHTNYYYRMALGVTFQKQKKYEKAIEEYSKALFLNEADIVSLTNRGECYLKIKKQEQAQKDFELAIELEKSKEEEDLWVNRSKALLAKLSR